MAEIEQIVFVHDDGTPTGEVGPKLASHTAHTRLHLAFSCYMLRRADNKFLVTQRAHVKKVWPNVWTNSVCGHPMPGETLEAAIQRRATYELGIRQLDGIACVLPVYTYRTPPYNGIIEHEFCPVFIAYTDEEPRPNAAEVDGYKWLSWPEYGHMLQTESSRMSYWCKDQYERIKGLEPFRSLG